MSQQVKKHIGYKTERITCHTIFVNYPAFYNKYDTSASEIISYTETLQRLAEKLDYNFNGIRLSHVGNREWIPSDRDDELNRFLNWIDKNPERLLWEAL